MLPYGYGCLLNYYNSATSDLLKCRDIIVKAWCDYYF